MKVFSFLEQFRSNKFKLILRCFVRIPS